MKIRKIEWPELITAFYINSFSILTPILKQYSYVSKYILEFEVVVLFIIYVFKSGFKLDKRNINRMCLIDIVVTVLFLIDFLFRKNRFTWIYYYYFLIYGAISAFFFVNVRNYKALLKYWSILAVVGGCMVVKDPLAGYKLSGGYMDFGTIILPAFASSFVIFFYYKIRFILPLLSIFFIEIILYANKGAIFSAIGIILFFTIYLANNKRERIKRFCIISLVSTMLLLFSTQILRFFLKVSKDIGVYSYSLSDVEGILSQGMYLNSYTARTGIWRNIILELKNNLFFGLGIGGFEDKYGNYAHNFFLDITITHGIIIGLFIILMVIMFIHNMMLYRSKDIFVFISIVCLLGILPMMFSFTYWKVNMFWIFVIISLYTKTYIGEYNYESFNTYI